MGYAQLLHMDPSLTPKQRGRVDAMFGAGKHLLEMITCVLDLSEIEADHVELRAVPVDVQSIAGACLDLIRPAAEAKGLALTLVVASGTRCELTVDPTRLRQVLLNLLGNAAKFTSNGSIALCLRASQDGSMLRIEVVDTGVGVPAHQLRRLFNEFERLDNEATRAAEGSGLGLALSARLTTLMGGRIGHENNPDGGSIFWLELPLPTGAASPGQPTATANQEKVASPPTHPLRVLIADDVPMNRDVGAAFLRAAGHDVISVEDGAQAFDTAARTDFDVVLMDVRMPVMDGLEATRRIRSLEGCRGQVPIVALTAHAFREQVAECETAGMTSHLAKPFTMQALIAAVYDAFASRKSPDAQPACADTAVNRPDAPATTPAVPAPPVLNRAMLDSTVAFLAPDAVAVYMRAIADQCETLLVGLRAANAGAPSAETLACAAHTLAGSAGTFGFERLSAAGRCFERAVETAGQGAHPDAGDLCAALEATLLAIDGMARGVDEAAA
jgi:CheY-like chemotaxis protein/HPt (histidine-containing phosphotransfer) domain-containing protein